MEKITYPAALRRHFTQDGVAPKTAELQAFIKATTPEEKQAFAKQLSDILGCEVTTAS